MGLTREDMLERLVCIRTAREDSGGVNDEGGRECAGEGEGGAVSAVSWYMPVEDVALCESGACICSVLSVVSVIIPRICESARLQDRNCRSFLPASCFGIGC